MLKSIKGMELKHKKVLARPDGLLKTIIRGDENHDKKTRFYKHCCFHAAGYSM